MEERSRVSNEVRGNQIDGSVVQVGVVQGGVRVESPVRVVTKVIREVRSLNAFSLLYRTVASLAACAAAYGMEHGGTPLAGLTAACDALGIPSTWTLPVEGWIAARSTVISGVAAIMVTVGLLTMPRPRKTDFDVGECLEWRGAPTTVLATSIVMQCGWTWAVTIQLVPIVAFWVWVAGKGQHNAYDRWDNVMIGVAALFLAFLFVPLYLCVWLFASDKRRAA
ncbi:hypothetical protein [Kitasatospora sp. NPDC088548]|uniref:hypothetical protein n=1 Tax=Kitasatospora sp. NPDC088548 TaxID=3364075 RepID=UPI00380E979C